MMTATEARPLAPDPTDRRSGDPTETAAHVTFAHRKALDGLRGLAVVAVICFHGEFSAARGGFLGVSLFFTLSGFLIASLAIHEARITGSFRIGAFWMRRARRLLPALIVAIALTVGIAAWVGDATTNHNLFGDVAFGIGYLANWHLVFTHTSYATLFTAPSPLIHLWSLGVEEQFYVIFPLVAALCLPTARRRPGTRRGRGRVPLGAVAAVAVGLGVLLPVALSYSSDRAYYGTDVRAGEIALGVLAAVLLANTRPHPPRRIALPLATLSTAALVLLVVCFTTLDQSGDYWRRGGFAAFAVISALVVSAAALDVGPVATLGRNAVLRRFGRVSYGWYLFHWPILWALASLTSWSATARFAAGATLSYVLAELSLWLIEDPIRTGRAPWTRVARGGRPGRLQRRRRVALRVAAGTLVVSLLGVLASALVVTRTAPPTLDLEAAQVALRRQTATQPHLTRIPFEGEPDHPISGDQPVRTIAPFGDSLALSLAIVLNSHLDGSTSYFSSTLALVPGDQQLGCGLLVGARIRGPQIERPAEYRCTQWRERWAGYIEQSDPDIATVLVGPWETWDFVVPGIPGWHHLGEPVFDEWALGELRDAVDILGAKGARVVFLTSPGLDRRTDRNPPCACPERLERLTELERQVAAERPDSVSVIEFGAFIDSTGESDREARPDGVHFDLSNQQTGVTVGDEFLFPALLALPIRER